MRSTRWLAFVAVLLGTAVASAQQSYRWITKTIYVPRPKINFEEDKYTEFLEFDVEWDDEYTGLHNLQTTFSKAPGSGGGQIKRWDMVPRMVCVQVVPNPPPPPNPQPPPPKKTKVLWMDIVAAGPDSYPGDGIPYLTGHEDDFDIVSAYLGTEASGQLPYTITPIDDLLTDVPWVVPMTVDGYTYDVTYDWDFSAFINTTGNYFLLSREVTIEELFTPEPGTLCLMATGLLMVRRRR